MKTAAIIVAAGRGTRLRTAGRAPKQYVTLAGAPVLRRTVEAFFGDAPIDAVMVVIHADDRALYDAAMAGRADDARLLAPAIGGVTRQASVHAGLKALKAARPDIDAVLIHDAARPFVTPADIAAVVAAVAESGAAIAAVPLSDTLKRAGPDDTIAGTVDRSQLWRALTPQGFRFDAILAAHDTAAATGGDFTDDAAVAEAAGHLVRLVATSPGNFKITTLEDLEMAERTLGVEPAVPDVRTGTGFDVHRFCEGDHVWLCGLKVAHTAGLEGHSDADVGLHALTDVLLGAIADGDIGSHFPPSDPQWKGAASDQFLAHAAGLVRARGARIMHADITLICEAPKIGPHRDAMRARVAEILAIDISRVSVKATTSEGLGFPGRREGIAAMASATVVFPATD